MIEGAETPLEAHKHVDCDGVRRCVHVRIEDGVLRACLDGRELYVLDVAHGPIALRFAKQRWTAPTPAAPGRPAPAPNTAPDPATPGAGALLPPLQRLHRSSASHV